MTISEAEVDGSPDTVQPPSRSELFRTDSTPISLTALGFGAAGLTMLIVGGTATIVIKGMGTAQRAASTLTSVEFHSVLIASIALGVLGTALAAIGYPRAPTKLARSQSTAAAILGTQAAVFAGGVLYFVQGDMQIFARNFLNFPSVRSWLPYFATGIKNTLLLTLGSTALGIVLGLVFAVFLISRWRIVRAPIRTFVNVMRGTPILLQLAIVYYGLALGLRINWSAQMALVFTLGLNASAYMAEVFRAGIQSIERAQLDAARGLGLSYLKAMRLIIIPQAIRRVIPPLMNDFIQLTKDTSLIAFLGVTLSGRELYTVATEGYGEFFNSTFFVAAGIGYLIVTLPLIRIVNAVEKRIRSGLVGVAG